MSMSATVNNPQKLEVNRQHQQRDGRVLVYGYEDNEATPALVLWISPEVAAKWVKALTPLAAEADQ